MNYLSKLMTAFIIVSAGVFSGVNAQPRVTGQDCVKSLRELARSQYDFKDDTSLDTAFSDAFCQVVKDKQSSKRNTNASGAYKAFSASLTDNQSQLRDYENTYCRDTKSKLAFKSAHTFYASVVQAEAGKNFNECMRIAGGDSGVQFTLTPRGTCFSNLDLSYVPGTDDAKKTARVKGDVQYNVRCEPIPKLLTPSPMTVACYRTSWGDASLSIATTQSTRTTAPIEFETLRPPAAPLAPVFPQTDSKSQSFPVVGRYVSGSTAVPGTDGRLTYGVLQLGTGAGNISVEYSCTGGGNLCGFSYGNRGGATPAEQYKANWSIVGDGSIRWSRYWDGDASNGISETYTVKWTLPHATTPAETAQLKTYEEELLKYRMLLADGPCPNNAPGGATKKTKVSAKRAKVGA